MKNFFSFNAKFNVFYFVGLCFIFLDIFYTKFPLNLIGLLIAFIPETRNAIISYKETGKIGAYLLLEIALFIVTLYLVASELLGI